MKRAAPDVPLQRWGIEWDKPVARMREFVQVVKLVLAGGTVDYDGQFFQLHNVQPNIVPSAPIPVWVAAGGPSMMRVAGAEADGVFTHMANRGMTERLRETVAVMTREAGREPEDVPLGNLLMVCVDDDAEVARAAMRHWLVDFYLSLPGYQELLAREGYEDVANTVREALGRGDVAGAEAAVPDGILDNFMLAGTPDDCRAKLREFVAWGTDLPILYPFPSREDWLDGYRRTIAAFAPNPAPSRSRRTA
jgi:alkanesulfonate monooxygenase SsuD/methylene tetrahydromethanopterin reductase-like flavin-dependent oxidoreductase (luciferase family)